MFDKYRLLRRIQELYGQNQNIMEHLRKLAGSDQNAIEDILISYDFQAGTYTQHFRDNPVKQTYCARLAEVMAGLGKQRSFLEVGVGEASTLGYLHRMLQAPKAAWYGCDLSWSRLKYAKRFLDELQVKGVRLFSADLFCLPFKDDAVDVVYTSHSLEPNGGKEREALQELYRVAREYLILLEPAYELTDNEAARVRMRLNGYMTNLYQTAIDLGYNILDYRLFGIDHNPLNPTGVMVIRKDKVNSKEPSNKLCCPLTHSNIKRFGNVYYSKDSFLAYPIIGGIPCLLPQNAIVATKLLDS